MILKPSQLEEHLTPDDCAKRLNVSVSTVRRWIRSGQLRPVFKPSRNIVLIPASAAGRFLRKFEV